VRDWLMRQVEGDRTRFGPRVCTVKPTERAMPGCAGSPLGSPERVGTRKEHPGQRMLALPQGLCAVMDDGHRVPRQGRRTVLMPAA
jgi:hypothetical protein